MATAGLFKLITNEGKQDRMLMATELLNKRLREIERTRARDPRIQDSTPTLVDIERTHVLFMNAHFKPFAAIGYEYNYISPESGIARLGSSFKFSIPQFGDFFHDMVMHVRLGAVEATNAAHWDDPANNPADGRELLRYVDYVGTRLVKHVRFTVNGNPLDAYSSETANFHQKFFVTPNKQTGWDRNMAQEVPKMGYADVASANNRSGRGAGVREKREVCDGPQTAKPSHDTVEMFIPLLFWFNQDPRLAIPSVSIPYGQRFIEVEFAQTREILQHLHANNPALDSPATAPAPVPEVEVCNLYINNIFVNPEVHDIFIKRIGFSLIRVHLEQNNRVNKATDNIQLTQLKWPVETLYLGLRPEENNNSSNSKMLEDWHSYSYVTDSVVGSGALGDYPVLAFLPAGATVGDLDAAVLGSSASGRQLDSVEVVTGAAAGDTLTLAVLNQWLGYYGFRQLDAGTALTTAQDIADAWPMPPQQIPDTDGVGTTMVSAGAGAEASALRYKSCQPTIDTLNIEAHGIPLYRDIPAQFFNSYVPFTYGGSHINTPKDCGSYMVPFNLYPGSYQPSGHINLSRAREFFVRYRSSIVDSVVNNADLVVVAVAINFLLISDGSAVLRYST